MPYVLGRQIANKHAPSGRFFVSAYHQTHHKRQACPRVLVFRSDDAALAFVPMPVCPGPTAIFGGGTAVRMAEAPTPPQYHWRR
jgi:hypothetical protein